MFRACVTHLSRCAIAAILTAALVVFGAASEPLRAQVIDVIATQDTLPVPVVKVRVPYSGERKNVRAAFSLALKSGADHQVQLALPSTPPLDASVDGGPYSLSASRPTRVVLSVVVDTPGVYQGSVSVTQTASRARIRDVDYEITVFSADPVITPSIVGAQKISLTRPALGSFATSDVEGDPLGGRTIRFDNKTNGALIIERASATLFAEGTGNSVDGAVEVRSPLAKTTLRGDSVHVALQFRPSRIPAGRYSGQVALQVAGQSRPTAVAPLAVEVREAWILPLLLLIVGVLVGRFTQVMDLPLARMQEELLLRVRQLGDQADSSLDEGHRAFIRTLLLEQQRAIESAMSDSERVTRDVELVNIRNTLLMLESLQEFRQHLTGLNGPDVTTLLKDADSVEALLRERKVPEAQAAFTALRDKVSAAKADNAAAADGTILPSLDAAVRDRLARPFQLRMPFIRDADVRPALWPLRPDSAMWRFAYMRPALTVILLVALSTVGFATLYLNDPVFGSGSVLDYLRCFLWGLGADAVTKTLQGIAIPKVVIPAS